MRIDGRGKKTRLSSLSRFDHHVNTINTLIPSNLLSLYNDVVLLSRDRRP